MATCFSLHPSFPITTENISLFSHARHTASDRKHSSYRERRSRRPFGGVLQSDSALEGPGTSKTSLKEKVAVDTTLPSPWKRHFRDCITHSPFTWWICLFPMWKKVNVNLCKLYSNPAHLERMGDQLIQHRKDLVGFSPLTWKQWNLRGVFAPWPEYSQLETVTGRVLDTETERDWPTWAKQGKEIIKKKKYLAGSGC